jgi:hypothetical protein
MKKALVALLLFVSSAFAFDVTRPDPVLTPGLADPHVTQENIRTTICLHGYTARMRHVTAAMKRKVIKAYAAKYAGWPARDIEVDHLISLELGGANDPANLWPETYAGPLGARVKDQAEDYLHRQVCSGRMTLRAAQEAISGDWVKVYRRMKGKR